MQEDLLQFIWKYNLYRPGALRTTEGEAVRVVHPGTQNRDAGPDFGMARIRLGDILLVGDVELHVRSSDWNRHKHDSDPAYGRVILHVVYEHDTQTLPGGIPVLELKGEIPPEVLDRYSHLIQTTAPLPCAGVLHKASDIVRSSWLSRMLVERWEHKLEQWQEELRQVGGDWNALFYRRLAANFGFKVNAAPFLLLAQSLPLNIVGRQSGLLQVEALVFGQSGLLSGSFADEYPKRLQAEYHFLRQKYSLSPIDPFLWKFLRLRPANFPTIRLAQFAALLHKSPQLLLTLDGLADTKSLVAELSVQAGEYWDRHYRWDDAPAIAAPKSLGTDAIHNIIINTVAPLRFLYAHTHGRSAEAESALGLLDSIPAENNNIIRMWSGYGWPPANAGGSQSMIGLYNNYCSRKRCLECAVGLSIIRAAGPDK